MALSLLGATGSIGRQTLDVAARLGLEVCALAAGSRVRELEEAARRFRPRLFPGLCSGRYPPSNIRSFRTQPRAMFRCSPA